MENPDFLIVGAGVIGCSLARELARVSRSVLVLDRGAAGGGASGAAAGLLSPGLATAPAGPLTDLCHDSAALVPSWVEELRADGAGDVGLAQNGLLDAWTDPARLEEHRRATDDRARPGRRVEVLGPKDLARLEPGLADAGLCGGAWYPEDWQVDPARLTRQVARVAALAGVRFHEGETVLRLVADGDRVAGVVTDSARYHPGQVILAAGCWSGLLGEPLHLHLAVRPVKGQLVRLGCRVPPVRVPVHAGEALLVPRPGGGLIAGVTVEEAGFDSRVTVAGLRRILDGAARLVPAVDGLSPGRAWAGLRPATPDGLPYMGSVPPWHNLWVTTGHFRKGLLLAPASARLMAQSILGNHLVDELQPFKPTRRLA